MRRATCAAVAMVCALVLAGCSDDEPGLSFPGKARIDVDTPQLRQDKKDAGVEQCEPGTGANDLPAITLPCFGGGPDVDLSTLEGPMVINVWAVYCGPCREEMPILEQFHQQYGDQVGILGVDYSDPQVEGAMSLVKDTGVTYPLLADPQEDLLGAEPFPTMFRLPMMVFIRADGSVTLEADYVESLDELVDKVDTNLGIQL